jgi:hypothetical protein
VNCLNVKKYILSVVSENFAVNVTQKVMSKSDTKSKSRDLSRLVSIPYMLYFSNFAIVFNLLLSLRPLQAFIRGFIVYWQTSLLATSAYYKFHIKFSVVMYLVLAHTEN